jgi:uncharacterized damage-inducible protein DinB
LIILNLVNLADYHVWAGTQIRQPVRELSGTEFTKDLGGRSVRAICEHILAALETCFYLATHSDDTSVFERIEEASKEELLQRWQELDLQLAEKIKEKPTGKITVPHLIEEPFDLNALDFYLQYVFHTIHHRGQLATALRSLGKDVPGTDYLMFFADTLEK